MKKCNCQHPHDRRRVVLTGGPGAGRTAVLELIRQSFCAHVKVLPEAIIFGGGFPRRQARGCPPRSPASHLFSLARTRSDRAATNAAIVLCDRGTVDGAAYWSGPGDLWSSRCSSSGMQPLETGGRAGS